MSVMDGRGFAWQQSMALLDWAEKARQHLLADKNFRNDGPLPEIYWSVVAAAAVYAELAKADIHVGLAGGQWFEQKWEDERESAEMRESWIEKFKARDQQPEGEKTE